MAAAAGSSGDWVERGRGTRELKYQRAVNTVALFGFPSQPVYTQVADRFLLRPSKKFAGSRRIRVLICALPRTEPAKKRLFCGFQLFAVTARVALTQAGGEFSCRQSFRLLYVISKCTRE